jgi:multidrug efflux pump subunit AcrA (membrane-fusion protein)
MTRHRFMVLIPALVVAASLFTGCGRKESDGHKEGDGHDHSAEKAEGKDDGHGHGGGEAPAGASFKAGKGVIVTEETKKLLGVEVTDVTEQKLPNQIRFTVQVFGEKHHHALNLQDHSGCDVHGSAFLASDAAAVVKPGQPAQIFKNTDSPLNGVVLTVQKALALGESEVVIGVSNATAVLESGEFVPARINLPRDEVVATIPQTALLRTSEGTFVYAVNGDAYFRTAVKTGSEADGWVEITDGLLAGDQVVTKPVETLWLIELRATKGGGHSH